MITGRFGFSYSCTKSCGRPCRSQSACASWQAQRMHRTSARCCVALAIAVPLLCSCPTRLHGSTRGLESNPHALALLPAQRTRQTRCSCCDIARSVACSVAGLCRGGSSNAPPQIGCFGGRCCIGRATRGRCPATRTAKAGTEGPSRLPRTDSHHASPGTTRTQCHCTLAAMAWVAGGAMRRLHARAAAGSRAVQGHLARHVGHVVLLEKSAAERVFPVVRELKVAAEHLEHQRAPDIGVVTVHIEGAAAAREPTELPRVEHF